MVLERAKAFLHRDPGQDISVWDDPSNTSRRKGGESLSSGVGCWDSGETGGKICKIFIFSRTHKNQGHGFVLEYWHQKYFHLPFAFAEWICLLLKNYSTKLFLFIC